MPKRYGPSGSGRAVPRIVGCSPDKPMLLISSSHEKQAAIKPRASRESREREFLYQRIAIRNRVSPASPRCRASLVMVAKVESFYINKSQSGIESPRRHLGAEHFSSYKGSATNFSRPTGTRILTLRNAPDWPKAEGAAGPSKP